MSIKPNVFYGKTLPENNQNNKYSQELNKKKQEIHDFFTAPVCMNQLRKSLPRVGITADRMVRILFSAIAQVPKLAFCTPKSLYNVMIQCAQIGLEPNTALGHAYIIPFKTTATLIIGYKGLIELCRRSKEFSSVYAHEVYPDDDFDMQLGTDPYIKHIPRYEHQYDEQDILGCYAISRLKDGSFSFEYMPKYEIEKIRARSKTPTEGPWMSDYVMMARKTVIKRLMHYQPLTVELAEAIKVDSENDVGISADIFSDAIDIEVEKQREEPDKESKKVDSSKKEQATKPKPREEKKQDKPVEQKPANDFENNIKSLELRGIDQNEICAYFYVENISDLNEQQKKELFFNVTEIESKRMDPEQFKKIAAERFEMAMKAKKK